MLGSTTYSTAAMSRSYPTRCWWWGSRSHTHTREERESSVRGCPSATWPCQRTRRWCTMLYRDYLVPRTSSICLESVSSITNIHIHMHMHTARGTRSRVSERTNERARTRWVRTQWNIQLKPSSTNAMPTSGSEQNASTTTTAGAWSTINPSICVGVRVFGCMSSWHNWASSTPRLGRERVSTATDSQGDVGDIDWHSQCTERAARL